MEDVWFVPGLKRNLFSEGAITKRGFTVVKNVTTADIKKNGVTVASAVRNENNLYKMQICVKTLKSSENAEVNMVATGTLKIWHERLGHLNKSTLKELFAKNLVDGVKLTGEEDFFCEGCVYRKQHRLKFPPIKKTETKPGELIYSDVCGPMSVESIGGSRYFVLFKDDCTGYR